MVHSPLTGRHSPDGGKRNQRPQKIDRFIVHHCAGTNGQAVLDMMAGTADLSANYVILNDGTIVSVVPEEYRAWTSGTYEWDGRAVTVEVVNETGGPEWRISAKAEAALAALIADVGHRYGFAPTRNGRNSTVIGHKELHAWYGASYPTACPGGINVDQIVKTANSTPTAGAPKEEEDMGYFVQVNSNGSKYFVRMSDGRKRKIGTPEWDRIRKAQGKGFPVPLIDVPQKELDSIPNW